MIRPVSNQRQGVSGRYRRPAVTVRLWKGVLFMAALLFLLPCQAHAFLTDGKEAANTVRTVEAKLGVIEEYTPPEDPAPGSSFRKRPFFINESTQPVYLRARIVFSSEAAKAVCEDLNVGGSWSETGGWYYYGSALQPQDQTEPLFDRVVFREDVTREEIDAVMPFEILVYAECVLSRSEGPVEAFSEVEGGGA